MRHRGMRVRYEYTSGASPFTRRILLMTDSANTDLELPGWLRWGAEGGNTPMFVRTVAEAALVACSPDYELLRPGPLELKRRHPEGLARRKGQNATTGKTDECCCPSLWLIPGFTGLAFSTRGAGNSAGSH